MAKESSESEQDSYEFPSYIAEGVKFPETPGDKKAFTVGLMGKDDPDQPLNWSTTKKGITLFILAFDLMVAAWGSAIGAPAAQVFQKVFHIGLPVAELTTSLYVLGFALGPIVWGPAGGIFGRKLPLCIGTFGSMLFFFAAATAKDFQTLVLSRFFQGAFGAGSLTVGPAIAGDIFRSHTRGTALTMVTLCIVCGPMVAPIVGGYIVQSYLGWRWTQYITGIMAALAFILTTLFIEESYVEKILQNKAATLREKTGNWAIRAPHDLIPMDLRKVVDQVLLGPIKMLATEPILMLITFYHGFIYGILYMCLSAIPIIFVGFRFPGANVFLPYISLLIGSILVSLVNIFIFEPWYNRELERTHKPVIPENRLPLMILSGCSFTIGIFWMCWAGAYPQHVHWIVPMIGAGFVGFGMIGIFLACFNYILDTYLMLSSMAFAANTFFRSAFGCAFPLFVHPMFINLGIQWAGTLVGCLAALLMPVPVLFYIYGARLRSISPFALNLDDVKKDDETKFAEEADDDFRSARNE